MRKTGQLRQILLISAGVLSAGIGAVGIIVPLLPTTVFLLIAAACFLRSSPTLYNRLTSNPLAGFLILSYARHRAISRRSRVISLIILWGVILASTIFVAEAAWLRILLLGIAVGVTIHLVLLRTLTSEMETEVREEMALNRARFDSR